MVICVLYTYIELKKKGLSAYQIEKEVKSGALYKIDKGLYSDKQENDELEIISKLYDDAVLTLDSAFHYYGLLSKKPAFYYLATTQKARKIQRDNVKQIFMTTRLHKVGACYIKYHGMTIFIYDLERMLIELVRNKIAIPYDTYHEVLENYKRLLKLLNRAKIEQYLTYFRDPKIKERLKKEFTLS